MDHILGEAVHTTGQAGVVQIATDPHITPRAGVEASCHQVSTSTTRLVEEARPVIVASHTLWWIPPIGIAIWRVSSAATGTVLALQASATKHQIGATGVWRALSNESARTAQITQFTPMLNNETSADASKSVRHHAMAPFET